MHRIKRLKNLSSVPRPCDYFDLIGGTGTGGLIALMLGRLEMPIDVAINQYVRFTKHVFSEKKIRRNELFKATRFEKAMKTMIESAGLPKDLPILGQGSSLCHSFVTAFAAVNMSAPRLFRSYEVNANQGYNCAVWKAARATTAAPKFFKAISIGDQDLKEQFISASLGCSNPVTLVLDEAKNVFGHLQKVACIVSIGTGHPGTISWKSSGTLGQMFTADLAAILERICTDCESTAEQLLKHFPLLSGVYYRLNVEQGLQSVTLVDWEKLSEIKTHTLQYFHQTKTTESLDSIARILCDCPGYIAFGDLNRPSISVPATELASKLDFQLIAAPTPVFTGRETILSQLDKCFNSMKTSVGLKKQHKFVLYGLGGSGKTQIALKFLQDYGNCFSQIYFVDSSTKTGIEQFFANLAKQANVSNSTMADGLFGWPVKKQNGFWSLIMQMIQILTSNHFFPHAHMEIL